MSVSQTNSWPITKLGESCEINGGFAFKSREYKKSGIPLVRISNLTDNRVDLKSCDVFIDENKLNEVSGYLLKRGDILIALSGATTGKYAVFDSDARALLNQRVGRIRVPDDNSVDRKFISYYIETLKAFILKSAYGAAQPNISTREISEFPFPLPVVSEQKRIVAKIEELFSDLDKAVEALKKAQAQLKTYCQAVLKYAFEGRLTHKNIKPGELPEGWKWVKLGDIVLINPKLSGIADSTQVSFIPMRNVEAESGVIDVSDTRRYAEVKKGFTSFANGDVIFAKITPCMENGKIAITTNLKNGVGCGSTEFHVLRCNSEIWNRYLFFFLMQESFRKLAKRAMSGAVGQQRVPKAFLEDAMLPLPSIADQNEIVKEIEKRLSEADYMEKTIIQSVEKAEATRQSILKKAFEGRLV